MPDYDIAAKGQTPDAMKSISGMLNFATTAQNLQRGAVALEKEKALLQPDIDRGRAESRRTQTALQHDVFKLDGDQSARAMQIAGGLFKDPRIRANDPNGQIEAISEARDQMIAAGVPKVKAEWYASQLTSKAHQPGATYNMLQNMVQANAGAQTQAGVLNTPVTPVGTGGAIQAMQLQSGAPGGMQPGQQVPTTLAPGSLENIETDPLGNKFIVSRSPQGSILNTRPVGSNPQPGGGGAQPGGGQSFASFAPGDREAIPVLQKERDEARTVLLGAPVAHATNRGVLQEIDNVLATGVAGPTLQKLASGLGASWDSSEKRASAYDLVGKYLERNALNAAASMGPQTNAYLEAQIKANGSLAYNPTAIKKITRLNDAIVTGSEMYQPGLERAIANNPQMGVLAKRQFDQDWAKNFDPMVMQLHAAQQEGNKAELQDLIKSIGGANSQRAQEILRKAKNLEKLSRDGAL